VVVVEERRREEEGYTVRRGGFWKEGTFFGAARWSVRSELGVFKEGYT